MSLEGPSSENCTECGKSKSICPVCDYPVAEVRRLKNGAWAAVPVSGVESHMLCAEWNSNYLNLYIHTEEQYEQD